MPRMRGLRIVKENPQKAEIASELEAERYYGDLGHDPDLRQWTEL